MPSISAPVCVLVAGLVLIAEPAQPRCSDLSLVLAVDSSASINVEEYALQIAGYASAFTDPEVQAAMESVGTVDLALVFWADSDFSTRTLPWHRIDSSADALQFSAEILESTRLLTGDTDIGQGLSAALDLIEMPGRCTYRAVVNVSGDGKASIARKRHKARVELSEARARAKELGVTVNGLAILNDEPDLAEYYVNELIVGEGSFVEQIDSFADFAMAIRKKIVREIGVTLQLSDTRSPRRAQPEPLPTTTRDGATLDDTLVVADLGSFGRFPPR